MSEKILGGNHVSGEIIDWRFQPFGRFRGLRWERGGGRLLESALEQCIHP